MLRRNWMVFFAMMFAAFGFILNGCGGDDNYNGPCATNDDCNDDQICNSDYYCVDKNSGSDGDTDQIDGDTDQGADGDDDNGTTQSNAVINAPGKIDFGAVNINDIVYKDLVISNEGTGTLVIDTMEITTTAEEDKGSFEFDEYVKGTTIKIEPNSSETFSIKLTANLPKEYYAILNIVNNDRDSQNRLMIVELESQYKGESKIEVSPASVEFGNVRVGDPGLETVVEVCNNGTGNKVVTINSVGLKNPSTASHFSYEMNVVATTASPYYLKNGECIEVSLVYMPQDSTIYPEMWENCFVLYNDADNEDDNKTEICMSGTASESSIRVYKNPVDFGYVDIGDTSAKTLTISNHTGATVTVNEILLSGNHCDEFELYLGEHGTFPFNMSIGEELNDIGVGYSPENTGEDRGCYFMIDYTQSDRDAVSKTAVTGWGRDANIPPIARVSRSANGADILAPIEIRSNATSTQKLIALFGDISNDPDEYYPLTYKWSLEVPSDQSRTKISDDTAANISAQLDLAGPYTFTLVVTDSAGLESSEKYVFINVAVNEKITVAMEFDGEGTQNVDLRWIDPDGSTCSRTTMTSQRSCVMQLNGIYNGSAFVSNYTTGVNTGGNKETIVHSGAKDGQYKIQVYYEYDCTSDVLGDNCGYGIFQKDVDVTIKLYLNENTEPFYEDSTNLDKVGDSYEWKAMKVQGLWNDPIPQ